MKRTDFQSARVTETPLPLAARNADGELVLAGFGPVNTARVQLAVTDVSGENPLLTLHLDESLDGEHWHEMVMEPCLSAREAKVILSRLYLEGADRWRIRWTISPGASFTFSLTWLLDCE